jgi:uncharacterized phage protein (TIGR01671 family)
MREIKFRGLSDNFEPREWFYGCLVNQDDKHYIIHEDIENMVIVDPETVGQYTGLKDKNGKEIYEGDILICKQYIGGNFVDYAIEKGYVDFTYGAFGLHRKQGYYRPFKDWLEDYELEVIGNIHNNPELLEGER